MTLRQLPPVGTPVFTGHNNLSASQKPLKFVGFSHTFLQSGTAALALALSKMVQHGGSQKRNVVIPGYGCPDLVAACEYAETQPVIVDFDANSYQYDLDQIKQLDQSLLAIICPSLLGISMPLDTLRKAFSSDVFIIEDNAQWFPESDQATLQRDRTNPLNEYRLPANTHNADFFITSFGRGKPVNLMGGGLLAWQEKYSDWFSEFNSAQSIAKPTALTLQTRVKANLFNWVCHPVPYGLISRIPALKLGATEYHRLADVQMMEGEKVSVSSDAISHYLSRPQTLSELLKKNLPVAWPQQSGTKRLLRLPLLAANREIRDTIVAKCNTRGLGASVMYGKPLVCIDQIREKVDTPFSTPIAQNVADGFFTLPLHPGVTFKHAEKMIEVLTPYFTDLKKVPA
ncbi:DegT/DnrJ/EryC1/StrS family aminotransferase [Alteromonas ponticola]|uniref:DegT/DnrJ/EryC1/StrS aminotransferase family protein n=1 Tax=Alteromonas ponticola TaxID=2720613 RepID=A0ABX1R0S7_9ALTE|nr:DegT/DnrJ/EryC1/StrS family aminotransferase [Alteromonas ponticola]NMH59067.1 hypothetical protein [Alteromonas ponticola]